MQVVANRTAAPVPGFKMNLFDCIANAGPKLPRGSGQLQQGEGRFYYPPPQMR